MESPPYTKMPGIVQNCGDDPKQEYEEVMVDEHKFITVVPRLV